MGVKCSLKIISYKWTNGHHWSQAIVRMTWSIERFECSLGLNAALFKTFMMKKTKLSESVNICDGNGQKTFWVGTLLLRNFLMEIHFPQIAFEQISYFQYNLHLEKWGLPVNWNMYQAVIRSSIHWRACNHKLFIKMKCSYFLLRQHSRARMICFLWNEE